MDEAAFIYSFKMLRLIFIAPLIVISLVFILGAYRYSSDPPPSPNVGAPWHYFPRPQHLCANSKTHAGQSKDLLVHADSQEHDELSLTSLNVHKDTKGAKSEDIEKAIPSEFSLVDGTRVSPPAPAADTDEYLAICKWRTVEVPSNPESI